MISRALARFFCDVGAVTEQGRAAVRAACPRRLSAAIAWSQPTAPSPSPMISMKAFRSSASAIA